MRRFLLGLLGGSSLTVFAIIMGIPTDGELTKNIDLIALISLLVGGAFCGIFWELEEHSGNGLTACINKNSSRRWFWFGFLSGLVNGMLILCTVFGVLFVLKQLPVFEGRVGLVLLIVGVLSVTLIPTITLMFLRYKFLEKNVNS